MIRQINRNRLLILFLIAVLGLLFLGGVVAYYTLIRSDELQDTVESQWTREITVAAKRGNILDADGEVLAQSASTQSVLLRPGEIDDPGEISRILAPILGMDEQAIYELASQEKVEVWLKRHISSEQASKIASLNLEGVDFFIETKRYYPYNDSLSQVLGYTTIDGVGQTGLEKMFEKYLAGENGTILVQTDAYQNTIPGTEQVFSPASDGVNVITTVNSAIQSFTEAAAEECMTATGASSVIALAMNPENSDIYSMVMLPAMDLNNIDRSDIDRLNELSRNRAVADAYEPGSTFKIITTAAALDSGKITTESDFNCIGYSMVNGEKIKCWRSGRPHGEQDLAQALQNSCNPCFVSMAIDMGNGVFYDYIRRFGFGTNTGINIGTDGAGIVTDPKYVTNSDLARIGFGQSIAVTPLQLLNAVCAVVNGGELHQPRLVKELRTAEGTLVKSFDTVNRGRVISEDTSATMRKLLLSVVENGSGSRAQIPGYSVGGKTGTAQLYGEDGSIVQNKHISSFVGFAPADDPKIAVLFIVYEADVAVDFGSVVAAPYAKTILEKSLKYMGIPADKEDTQLVEVPDICGLSYEEAKNALESVGLKLEAMNEAKIQSQLPVAGTEVVRGSYVFAETDGEESSGGVEGKVPDIEGMNLFDAITECEKLGINLRLKGEVGGGEIIWQSVPEGTEVDFGMMIEVRCE
ncbi:MAG: PASTA domain-containing protein [Christensenellaceae bacterium]|nr:PASTA domain-containing protein [Christensenellaceae bacterium]